VSDSGYQLRKIHGPTREHVDDITGNNTSNTYNAHELRIYSMIIALNSDYDGGEFHFPEQKTIIKLKAGQAILFPPYWTHPHYTGELNGTFRYTINTWITRKSVNKVN
jgi:predicted 2-oxoglutarate/Fe(II)-dependent dioxygenase YbiX